MRKLLILGVPAALFGGLCLMDILREPPPWDPWEIGLDLAEKAMLMLLILAVAWSALRLGAMREETQALGERMARTEARGEDWRAARSAEIAAMGGAIAREFEVWGLTPAETDVAGLLLKGCSMKEIARARDTTEATIRQQAQSLYRKSGLSGRAELQAYFLDSLFDGVAGKPPLRAV